MIMRCRLLRIRMGGLHAVLLLNAGLMACSGASLQWVSVINSAQMPPAVGSGDSVAPVLSADGRYVLFASTAKNLVLNSNGNALPWTFPARLNVFRRDRTNNITSLVSVNLNGNDGGSYHDGADNFVFADGHSESHKWLDPRTTPPINPGQFIPLNISIPGDVDIDWLQQHTSELAH